MTARAAVLALLALVLAGCSSLPGVVTEPLSEFLDVEGRDVRVERVLDGDTLVVTGDERVRLLTIDAPELNSRSAEPPECGAEAARDALAELLPVGTPIVLNGLKGSDDQDRYGRTLSNAYVQDGDELTNVSMRLVGQGWAEVYADYPTADTAEAELLQGQARATGAGIWGMC